MTITKAIVKVKTEIEVHNINGGNDSGEFYRWRQAELQITYRDDVYQGHRVQVRNDGGDFPLSAQETLEINSLVFARVIERTQNLSVAPTATTK